MGSNRKRNTEQPAPYSPGELADPAMTTNPPYLTDVDVPPPSTPIPTVGKGVKEEQLALWVDPAFVAVVREALGLGATPAPPRANPHQHGDAPPDRQPFFTTGHNTAEQLFSAGFLREDDPRFAFATYKDVPMDGLAKTAARLPWASYTISYPGHTMDTHFSHVVHWGASANLDLPAFCRMAAPLYGHAATFLLDQRIALATPGEFPSQHRPPFSTRASAWGIPSPRSPTSDDSWKP